MIGPCKLVLYNLLTRLNCIYSAHNVYSWVNVLRMRNSFCGKIKRELQVQTLAVLKTGLHRELQQV